MRRTVVAVSAVLAAFTVLAAADTRNRAEPPLDDAAIAGIFDAANANDIETGNLAKERATSKEVREFGTMLSETHTAVRLQARDLAMKIGVTPVAPKDDRASKDHAAAMAKLRAVPAPGFDRAFLEHERTYHANVVRAINTTLIPQIQNAELKTFVSSLVPQFEGHRQAADSLLKKTKAIQ
jgi:putative membrane protein